MKPLIIKNLITPVILAGGKSTRMGKNKSFVLLANQKMIEIIVSIFSQRYLKSQILIVTNELEKYSYLGTDLVSDSYKGFGPLAGLEAALNYVQTPYIFLTACDMPFIKLEVIDLLSSYLFDYDVIIIKTAEGQVEPLQAIYSKKCLSKLKKFFLKRQIYNSIKKNLNYFLTHLNSELIILLLIHYYFQKPKLKMISFFKEVKVKYLKPEIFKKIDPDLKFLTNVNTPIELANAELLLKK